MTQLDLVIFSGFLLLVLLLVFLTTRRKPRLPPKPEVEVPPPSPPPPPPPPPKAKLAVVVAGGKAKAGKPMRPYELFKSARIRRVIDATTRYDTFILTAKHGLVHSFREDVEPYDFPMTAERAEEIAPSVAANLGPYDVIVYYKGGANKNYVDCMKLACEMAAKPLVICGYAIVGGIDDLPTILKNAEDREFIQILDNFGHTDVT